MAQVSPKPAHWSQAQEITAPDGEAQDMFGLLVASSSDGRILVVGAENKTVGSMRQQGAVYVFSRRGNSWSQSQKLTASDGTARDSFGEVSISSNGGTLVVGASSKRIGSNRDQGVVYVFRE